MVVLGADLADGLLSVTLKRELPESMKPRRIEIGVGSGAPAQARVETGAQAGGGLIEGQAEAA